MLTKQDLKEIEKLTKRVVREEVETEGENIRIELGSDIRMAGMRTTHELSEVNNRLKNLEIRSSRVEKGIIKLQRDLKVTSNTLDVENLKTLTHLSLTPTDQI